MNNDEERAKTKALREEIFRIIDAVGTRLSQSEVALIREFNEVGEYQLAVETLLFDVIHQKLSISRDEREKLASLGSRLKVEDELLAPYQEP